MTLLLLWAMLGIHRTPANTKKMTLWLQNANISQLSQDARHQWGTTQQEVTPVTSKSTQEDSRCSPVLSLSGSCMSSVSKAHEHVAESSHLCRDSLNAAQVLG